jgi:hypothetical protein
MDWLNSLINDTSSIVNTIVRGPTVTTTAGGTTTTLPAGVYAQTANQIPSWVWPAGLVVVGLFALSGRK